MNSPRPVAAKHKQEKHRGKRYRRGPALLSAGLLGVLLLAACSLFPVRNDAETNFELLWEEFNELYALFGRKGIDWEDVYDTYRPQVTPSTGEEELFQIVTRTKNGPGPDDFTAPTTWVITPEGQAYLGSIVVLTDGQVFSAAETFLLVMQARAGSGLPTTRVGLPSGGGMSSRIHRELPNGWIYTISIQDNTDPEGISYEGVGFAPDVPVSLTEANILLGSDPQLEAAVLEFP